jgi:predicted peptidase
MEKLLAVLIVTGALLCAQVSSFAAGVSPDPKDPQYQAKGDQKRTYAFPGTGERIPYHLFVPAKWNKNARMPLVIVLHGAGASPDTPFERGDGVLAKIAEQRGYIVVAPLGYRTGNPYNNPFRIVPSPRPQGAGQAKGKGDAKGKGAPPQPLTAEDRERSEQDVMNVAELVASEYSTDPKRLYLMGNSMGGGGTWYLGQKYPDRWAAISPSAGPVSPEEFPYDRLKGVPVQVVHGDHDDVTSFDASLRMIERAKERGVNVEWVPVKDGDHFGAWTMVAPRIFDFFDQHRKK